MQWRRNGGYLRESEEMLKHVNDKERFDEGEVWKKEVPPETDKHPLLVVSEVRWRSKPPFVAGIVKQVGPHNDAISQSHGAVFSGSVQSHRAVWYSLIIFYLKNKK